MPKDVMLTGEPGSLKWFRERLGVSQAELGRRLSVSQPQISDYEASGDPKLSQMVAYLGGLGGKLELYVEFPGGDRWQLL